MADIPLTDLGVALIIILLLVREIVMPLIAKVTGQGVAPEIKNCLRTSLAEFENDFLQRLNGRFVGRAEMAPREESILFRLDRLDADLRSVRERQHEFANTLTTYAIKSGQFGE